MYDLQCWSIKCYETFFYMVFIENSNHYLHYIVTVGELSCLYLLQVRIDSNRRSIAAKNKCGKYVCFTLESVLLSQ